MAEANPMPLRMFTHFRRARRRAFQEDLLALLRKRPADLLPFEAVKENLHLANYSYRELQSVPLDNIVGSVGRYHDFTRHFWPRQDTLKDRWARIAYAMLWRGGLPPVHLYQVGEVYFVKDGNHRVSVARYLGAPTIEAYVWEFHTRVPFRPDTHLSDLPLIKEVVEFLEHTDLDRVRPQQQIRFTVSGTGRVLEEHVLAHRYWLESRYGNVATVTETVGSWYDLVYMPMLSIIRERNLQRYFPRFTETDLYVGILNHHRYLVRTLERPVSLDQAIENYVDHFSPNLRYRLTRLVRYWLRGERRPPLSAPTSQTAPVAGNMP